MSDAMRNYQKALFGFDAVVRRVEHAQWDNQSPCPDWNATDVVAHNIAMNDMIAGFTRGESASTAPEAPIGEDPAAEWRASLDALMAALDAEGALQSVAATPWGEMPVDKFLGFVWVDPLIHTWDLAVAIGQEPVMDQAQVARGVKHLTRVGDSLVNPGRFDAAVATSSEDPVSQLIALSGRNPAA